MKKIDISEENYVALCSWTKSSETINDALTRLVKMKKPYISYGNVNLEEFKEALLSSRVAQVCVEYYDRKERDLLIWKATKIKEDSNIRGNIQSNYLRDWRSKRISGVNVDVLEQKSLNLEYLSISSYLGLTYHEFSTLDPIIYKNALGEYDCIDFKNQCNHLLSKLNKDVLNGVVVLDCKFLPRKPNPFLDSFVNPNLRT